jgi:hypothetical protein
MAFFMIKVRTVLFCCNIKQLPFQIFKINEPGPVKNTGSLIYVVITLKIS